MESGLFRIGHRGAAGYAPENTISSLQEAIRLGADYVEIDIQLTADGQLVLMHDKRVDRTTNGSGRVSELRYSELRQLDAGEGEKVPSLSEALQVINGRIGLMLEMITPGIAERVLAEIKKAKLSSPVLFASFLHDEILRIKTMDPAATTIGLFEGIPIGGAQFLIDARASYAGLSFDSITQAFVDQIHASEIKVLVYTLNDPRDIAAAIKMRVDGIVSNYPDLIPEYRYRAEPLKIAI